MSLKAAVCLLVRLSRWQQENWPWLVCVSVLHALRGVSPHWCHMTDARWTGTTDVSGGLHPRCRAFLSCASLWCSVWMLSFTQRPVSLRNEAELCCSRVEIHAALLALLHLSSTHVDRSVSLQTIPDYHSSPCCFCWCWLCCYHPKASQAGSLQVQECGDGCPCLCDLTCDLTGDRTVEPAGQHAAADDTVSVGIKKRNSSWIRAPASQLNSS